MACSVNNQDQFSTPTYFIPHAYISSVKNRLKVTELSKEQIQEAMKTANIYEQEVILHDLLVAGMRGESKTERDFNALAAHLFVQSSDHLRRDFGMSVTHQKTIFNNFIIALLNNYLYHEAIESKEKGSSGLTELELAKEKFFALSFEKYRA